MFRFKNRVSCNLASGVVYKYMCDRCNSFYYEETQRHLKVWSGEQIEKSPLTFKKMDSSKESLKRDHLLQCDNNPFFDEFTIAPYRNKKYLLKIKESILIKRNQPVLKKNISSITLHLFNTT